MQAIYITPHVAAPVSRPCSSTFFLLKKRYRPCRLEIPNMNYIRLSVYHFVLRHFKLMAEG